MASILTVLGRPKKFKRRPSVIEDLRQQVRAGLPFSALEYLLKTYSLTLEETCRSLRLPPRTIARRKKRNKLSPDESDKLVRLAGIAARASEVLGGEENASLWLKGVNRALGGVSPLSLLDTDIGARQVEAVLGRIEHGIYS